MSTMTLSAGLGRPAVQRRATAPAGGPARLTRRGRLLVSLAVLLLAVSGAVLLTGGGAALAGTDRPAAPRHQQVTVQPGQTLWQIAERTAPGSDPRETVQRILDLNGLQTSEVQAGTALQLP